MIKPALAVAALITLSVLFWPREPASIKEATSNGVATLSQLLDAAFEDSAPRSGDTITPGRLRLSKGLARIDFFSGATILIEGGTELEILSAWEARCHSGRLRAHVPPAARGFLVHAPGMKLEDLGTEFALNVQDGAGAVHVFTGEVIVHTEQAPASLTEGMSFGKTDSGFLPISDLQQLLMMRQQHRHETWQQWSQSLRQDPRLIAYYTFNHPPNDRWDRVVHNLAEHGAPGRSGGAVGARWTQGRWPGKEALEFKRPGDRVRLHLDGTYDAITLACWVKVDSVDKKYNSLLLTDGYDNGEPHWQIYEDGSLMFSIIYRPSDASKSGQYNQMYFSKPVFTHDTLGRWHHIAVSYDNQSGEVIQFFDGEIIHRQIHPLHQPDRPIRFGHCEIGNWGLPTKGHAFPIRNLNGAIDEFALFSTALSAQEVQSLFAHGRPE